MLRVPMITLAVGVCAVGCSGPRLLRVEHDGHEIGVLEFEVRHVEPVRSIHVGDSCELPFSTAAVETCTVPFPSLYGGACIGRHRVTRVVEGIPRCELEFADDVGPILIDSWESDSLDTPVRFRAEGVSAGPQRVVLDFSEIE